MKIEVKKLENKGWGVVTTERIQKGEIIEKAPVILYTLEEEEHIDKTKLCNYTYAWESGKTGAIVMGYGSLYNHSYKPNARYERNFQDMFMDYVALCDIEAGAEVTINYNYVIDDMTPVWFEVF